MAKAAGDRAGGGTNSAQQGKLEGEGAPEQEGDEVRPPVRGDVRGLFHEDAFSEDAVQRQVGAEVRPRRCVLGLRIPGIADVEDGAGLGVALSEEEKVVSEIAGENHEVGLQGQWWARWDERRA